MYSIIKSFLFRYDAEKVHHFIMSLMKIVGYLPFGKAVLRSMFDINHAVHERTLWELKFKNIVGLAAGFDKNGKYIDVLACLGFGFIEVGTVTPRPQKGNDLPRLFRLPQDEAIINRMGFNNDGVDALVMNLMKVKDKNIIIGGNIGKNKDTPNEEALQDYLTCFQKLYDYVHYFVINVSSPNTPGLRALQEKEPLSAIINALTNHRAQQSVYKPLLLKIAPDLSTGQLDDIISICHETNLDGLVISNTTLDRDGLSTPHEMVEHLGAGGLSGRPLLEKSTAVLSYVSQRCDKPIIGVGGIHTTEDMQRKLTSGASLVQVYTGFVYIGPALVRQLLRK